MATESEWLYETVKRYRQGTGKSVTPPNLDAAVVMRVCSSEMELRARVAELTQVGSKTNEEICQSLGKALGYPWFKDDQKNFPDATEESGVCVGEHVAETITEEAAEKILNLCARVAELERKSTQRGARMQIMREWMSGTMWDGDNPWREFQRDYPESEKWFDKEGVPSREGNECNGEQEAVEQEEAER